MEKIHDWVVDKIIRIFFRKQAVEASKIMLLSIGVCDVKPLRASNW